MTTARVVKTSVTVNNNSPIQDYAHPDDHTQLTPPDKLINNTFRANKTTGGWVPSNCNRFGRGHVRYYSRISLALLKFENSVVAYANQTKSIHFIEFRSQDINHLIKNLSHIIFNFKDTTQFHVFTKVLRILLVAWYTLRTHWDQTNVSNRRPH